MLIFESNAHLVFILAHNVRIVNAYFSRFRLDKHFVNFVNDFITGVTPHGLIPAKRVTLVIKFSPSFRFFLPILIHTAKHEEEAFKDFDRNNAVE